MTAHQAFRGSPLMLANGIIGLAFDPGTGSLVQIRDLRTGREYLSDPGEGRLLRVFAPDPEHWLDRYADSHQSGRPDADHQGDTLTLRWRDLKTPQGASTGVGAAVTVKLPPGADQAGF